MAFRTIQEFFHSDSNISHFRKLVGGAAPSLPRQIRSYLLQKVPIIRWLPQYDYRWIINDLIAGITIGVLLVPQSLSYATVANIPGQYGLISSWIPPLLYAIMGTSKGKTHFSWFRERSLILKPDVTAGPTAIMALLTGNIVSDLVAEGYTDHDIATVVAFFVGIYSLAVGLFKLGFLLDFIALPVLTGYVSAAALTIVFQQIPTLFGETNLPTAVGSIIHDFFAKLHTTSWRTFLIGWSGVTILAGIQFIGQRWGKKYRALWFLSICRNAIVLILFTGISYAVNKDHVKSPLFAISKTTGTGILTPRVPEVSLFGKVAGKAATVWIAAALEHLAIGKSFGRRHKYTIDESQELTYIGTANLIGSFFSAMPITGGFSRTAVNSESGVRSPLSGIFTSACVIISIYKLSGAFYWIPKATLSAIIVVAVWPIIIGPKTFYRYWQLSFVDFVASMLSFWVTLFVSVEVGIATAVAFSIAHTLLRIAFSKATLVTPQNFDALYPSDGRDTRSVPLDTLIFRLDEPVLYPNAYRLRSQILHAVKASHAESDVNVQARLQTRLWNDVRSPATATEKTTDDSSGADNRRPSLRAVTLDLSGVSRIDTTGMQMLFDLKADVRAYAGDAVAFEFVGMKDAVRRRFERANWVLLAETDERSDDVRDGGDIVFDVLQGALHGRESSAS